MLKKRDLILYFPSSSIYTLKVKLNDFYSSFLFGRLKQVQFDDFAFPNLSVRSNSGIWSLHSHLFGNVWDMQSSKGLASQNQEVSQHKGPDLMDPK